MFISRIVTRLAEVFRSRGRIRCCLLMLFVALLYLGHASGALTNACAEVGMQACSCNSTWIVCRCQQQHSEYCDSFEETLEFTNSSFNLNITNIHSLAVEEVGTFRTIGRDFLSCLPHLVTVRIARVGIQSVIANPLKNLNLKSLDLSFNKICYIHEGKSELIHSLPNYGEIVSFS